MASFSSTEQASRNTAMLGAFESIVVDQTKSFLLSVGREIPDLNKIAQKIKDIPSICKNISLIVLITYTRIYNKRPQGLELSAGGTVDELANLKILVQSVAAGAAGGGAYGDEAYGEAQDGNSPDLDISAEAILTSNSRADAALHLHKLVKLLDQLHRETRQAEEGDEEYDDEVEEFEEYNDCGGGNEFGRRFGHHGVVRPTGRHAAFADRGYSVAYGGREGDVDVDDDDDHDAGYVEAMMRDAARQQSSGGGMHPSQFNEDDAARPRPASRFGPAMHADPATALEDHAAAVLGAAKKQKQASLRRATAVRQKQHSVREANLRRLERLRAVKRVQQAADLERWELSQKLRADADRRRGADDLMAKVLAELGKDLLSEDSDNADHLKALEQQRISQCAAAGQLFEDRAAMIAQKAKDAEAYQTAMRKGQEEYMNSVLREADARHRAALDAKLQQLNDVEDAARLSQREAQASLAALFTSTQHAFTSKDRIATPTAGNKSPFEATLRRIRSNALELRQQQRKRRKERELKAAYAQTFAPRYKAATASSSNQGSHRGGGSAKAPQPGGGGGAAHYRRNSSGTPRGATPRRSVSGSMSGGGAPKPAN